MKGPEKQLERFIAKYTPEIASLARAAIAKMNTIVPGATILVYDNYNALAIGFAPNERASDAIFSLALFPRWVSLFFLQGASLPDPEGMLAGSGKKARHRVLRSVEDLDMPAIRSLIVSALERARVPIKPAEKPRIIIKSVAKSQRPRRPVAKDGTPNPGTRRSRRGK